jgi:phosphoglycerate dehydrogenase-like enzyme
LEPVTLVSLLRLSDDDRARIMSVDPKLTLIDAGGWFDGEYRETWEPFAAARYVAGGASGRGTRTERDELLGKADVILGGFPFPLDMRARARKLKWFHQRPAGASNLLRGDLWGSDVTVTTSRGVANALAIAEYAVAGIHYFAKGFHRAVEDRAAGTFDARAYSPVALAGKTACIVGAGGIGSEVGRLCAALGMRVVGTRARPSLDQPLPDGFHDIAGPDALERFLPKSDFVVIACQWTPQTNRLFDRQRFALMKQGAVLVNVARGEIIDETALMDALQTNRLRGVVLDVYDGEFERPPAAALWSDPRVLITPHISGNSDRDQHGAIALFCDNLRAWLDGRPLRNVIDWERGY